MDTIFALATAPGRAGVAVIRVSGPRCVDAVQVLSGIKPEPRLATLRSLRSDDGEVIDKALVLRFESGKSFTGEDVIELQTHGSSAVVSRVLQELGKQPGLRHAEAGEFTRRAFLNQKLDLVQIEGLADLISAETEAQRRQASRMANGAFSSEVELWRSSLLSAMSLIEATIDFADEDVPVDVVPDVISYLDNTISSMKTELAGVKAAKSIRDGFDVAIVGRPNVGKSTLLNYLAGRDVAITSEIAGTTRDVLEVRMNVGGIPVTFLDTAGLRDSSDEIERLGVERARERAEQADMRLCLVSSCQDQRDVDLKEQDMVLVAKDDINERGGISGVTGVGVQRVLSHIETTFSEAVGSAGGISTIRQFSEVEAAVEWLVAVRVELAGGAADMEVVAEDLRASTMRLEAVVGRVDVEQVLDGVFSRFCIGK